MSPLALITLPRIRMQPQIESTWLNEGLKYNLDLTIDEENKLHFLHTQCVDTYLPHAGKLVQDFQGSS